MVDVLAVAAARLIAHHVVDTECDRALYDVHGTGAFSRCFDDEAALRTFVERPQFDDVVFNDEPASVRLGDLAVGAVRSRQRLPVVVVDTLSPGTRVTLRGVDDARPYIEDVALKRVDVAVAPVAADISDARAAHVTALVRRAPPSDERRLFFIGVEAPDDELECVPAADFEQFIASFGGDGDHSRAVVRLIALMRDHDPATHTVVWVRGTTADWVWLVATASSPPRE